MFISELDAVNFIRSSVGKAPVATLTSTNPDTISAKNRLNQTTLELQSKSWWFNTELGLTLTPDGNGELTIPGNAIEARPQDPFTYLTTRGSRVYDPCNNTFTIDKSVKFDFLLVLDFDDLPFQAANYIQYLAARRFVDDFDGDPQRTRALDKDVNIAWLLLKEAEQRNRRSNVLNSFGPIRLFSGIQPRARFSRNPILPGG